MKTIVQRIGVNSNCNRFTSSRNLSDLVRVKHRPRRNPKLTTIINSSLFRQPVNRLSTIRSSRCINNSTLRFISLVNHRSSNLTNNKPLTRQIIRPRSTNSIRSIRQLIRRRGQHINSSHTNRTRPLPRAHKVPLSPYLQPALRATITRRTTRTTTRIKRFRRTNRRHRVLATHRQLVTRPTTRGRTRLRAQSLRLPMQTTRSRHVSPTKDKRTGHRTRHNKLSHAVQPNRHRRLAQLHLRVSQTCHQPKHVPLSRTTGLGDNIRNRSYHSRVPSHQHLLVPQC